MSCQQCINDCCHRWCVERLDCAMDCCGCCHIAIMMGPNQNWCAGQIIAKNSSDLKFYIFDPFASDGTEVPVGLSMYHVLSDENGNAQSRYFNALSPFADCGQPYTNMYVCGIFHTSEVRGDVSAALASRVFRILEGDTANGLIKLQ